MIDCIVSDYEMPGMDGLVFFDAVRAEHPNLPFILFTGQGSEELASTAISAGITDYMREGFRNGPYALLTRRIHNAIGCHRAQRRVDEAHERTRTILEASLNAVLVSSTLPLRMSFPANTWPFSET